MQAASVQTPSNLRSLSILPGLEGLPAVLTVGAHPSSTRTLDAVVWSVNREGIVLGTDDVLGDVEYAWLEIDLPDHGTIRPLMRVEQNDGDTIWLTFRHLFPRDKARLLAATR